MTDYKLHTPDRWVVVEITPPAPDTPYRKLFAGWMGGYTYGDSWRLSSNILRVETFDDRYEFHSKTGSIYKCGKSLQGMSGYMANVYNHDINNPTTLNAGFSVRVVEEYR